MTCSDCTKEQRCKELAKSDDRVASKIYKNNFWESAEKCKEYRPKRKAESENEKFVCKKNENG